MLALRFLDGQDWQAAFRLALAYAGLGNGQKALAFRRVSEEREPELAAIFQAMEPSSPAPHVEESM